MACRNVRLRTDADVLRAALTALDAAVSHVSAGTIVFKNFAGKVVRPYHPLMTTGRGDNAIPPTGGDEPERKSFVFDQDASDTLDRLQKQCRQSSASNLVRHALVALEDMVEPVRKGKIDFVNADGSATPFHRLLLLPTSSPQFDAGQDTSQTPQPTV